jgi:hypothetical protein
VSLRGWIVELLGGDRDRREGYRQGYADAMRSAAIEARAVREDGLRLMPVVELADRLDAKADLMERA